NLLEQLLDTIPGRANTAGKFMLLDLLSYLPGDLLVKTDITSMMNSLECRCPFLDRDLVELALSIPDKEKIKGKWGKVCLRSSFSDLLPDEINKRPKTGFGVPLARWFRQGKHSDYLCELLLEKNTDFFTLVNRQELEKELRLHRRGKIDIAPLLWAVAVFKLWFTELQIKI
ncbi:MAG: asparagine synthase-related protein, partial [bacterium]